MCMPKSKKIQPAPIEKPAPPPPAPNKPAQYVKSNAKKADDGTKSEAGATARAKKKGRRSLRIPLSPGVTGTKARGLNVPGASRGLNVPAG